MKILRRLRPKQRIFYDFFVFDLETRGLRAQPKAFIFGVVYSNNFTKVIYSVEDFKKEFLAPRYKGKNVFAHNAGDFDLNVLYENVFKLDPSCIYNGSRFIRATNGNCIFADSVNIFVGHSVKKLGDFIGMPKLDIDVEYLDPDSTHKIKITSKMINYCIRDCEIVYESLMRFFEYAGDIKITQASLSLTFFRRFHQPYDIYYKEKEIQHFYHSYYGGRTEVFKLGSTSSRVIDVNSMYPFAMMHTKFPNPKYLKSKRNIKISKFENHYLKRYEGCANLTIIHKPHYFGFLPFKSDSKLCFPIGTFSGDWNFNEIRYALSQDIIEIKEVHKITFSQPMSSIFRPFIEDTFKRKLEAEKSGDSLTRDIMKRFSNSLYGKFAQRIDSETWYVEDIEENLSEIIALQKEGLIIKIDTFNHWRTDAIITLKRDKPYDIANSIPSFSSYITSTARIILLKQLVSFYNSGQTPVYCDTDSIFYEGEKSLNSSKLGGWKTENKIITEIRGLKNYSGYFPETDITFNRIKGVPTFKAIPSIGFDAPANDWHYQTLVKSKEALRRNIENGVLVHRKKSIKGDYKKRIILENGETKPLEICT